LNYASLDVDFSEEGPRLISFLISFY
jgi:hypothetical protein